MNPIDPRPVPAARDAGQAGTRGGDTEACRGRSGSQIRCRSLLIPRICAKSRSLPPPLWTAWSWILSAGRVRPCPLPACSAGNPWAWIFRVSILRSRKKGAPRHAAVRGDENSPVRDIIHRCASRHVAPGMMRRMNRSNRGTVKAVSPRVALQTMPLAINWPRVGAEAATSFDARSTSPTASCGSPATARRIGSRLCSNRPLRHLGLSPPA